MPDNTIGRLDWSACYHCKNIKKEGGCKKDVPDNIELMELDCDSIECTEYEES